MLSRDLLVLRTTNGTPTYVWMDLTNVNEVGEKRASHHRATWATQNAVFLLLLQSGRGNASKQLW